MSSMSRIQFGFNSLEAPVHIKHTEDLSKHLFWASIAHDVENHLIMRRKCSTFFLSQNCILPYHEFYKINIAVIVGIVNPEHVLLHFVCIISLRQSLNKTYD